jgi:glycosyltransferase involved in cell wall biosynthesis
MEKFCHGILQRAVRVPRCIARPCGQIISDFAATVFPVSVTIPQRAGDAPSRLEGAQPVPGAARRIRLLILLRSFSAGGAERQLLEFLKRVDRTSFEVLVVCFYRGDWHREACAIEGITVSVLDKRHRYDLIGFGARLFAAARAFAPDVIYGYMFAADILALATARLTRSHVVWGLRCSRLDHSRYDLFTRLLHWLSCRFARGTELLIANSHAGLADYVDSGARPQRQIVVPNGIDVQRFRPDAAARIAVRRQWGRSDSNVIIGLVARIDPMKGHDVFLHAAAQFSRIREDAWYVCVGAATSGNRDYEKKLRGLADSLGVSGKVMWVGHVDAVEAVYPALDVLTSASRFGEGWSNTVGEAMACGVPCVVSDVGDSARIVGESGCVVAAGDASALCDGWRRILEDRAREPGARERERIVANFSIEASVAATEAALKSLVPMTTAFPVV